MNVSAVAKIRINVDDRPVWSKRQPDGRYEPVDGASIAIPRKRFGHNRAKGGAVHAAALPCPVFFDRVGVKVSEETLRRPDVVACCGAESQAMIVEAPVVAVEGVSRSRERDDVDTKFRDDFTVASICHDLVFFPGRHAIVHRKRNAAGKIESRIIGDGKTALDPSGFSVSVVALPP